MARWKWWRPPWLRGMGEWFACVTRTEWCLFRFTRSGWLVRSAFGAFPVSDRTGQVECLQVASEEMMRRRIKSDVGVVRAPHADATELLETHPNLAAWLTDPTFEDGVDRPGGWIGLSASAGLFTLLLKDAGERVQLRIQAPCLSRAFALVEDALCDPSAPWMHDSGAFRARQGKSKK